MRFWRSVKRVWELWVAAPKPLKVLYFVLACGLAFGLAASIARLESGSDGERQVMDFIDGLITVIAIVGAPVLLMGLAMFVVHQITRGRQNEISGRLNNQTPEPAT
jgi:cytochrome c oxidase assembly factor CtaG